MILVDTSIWVDHLRAGNAGLVDALEQGSVLMHPFILGELACGNLQSRSEILALLGSMPGSTTATDAEALAFIEQHALMGRGIGYVDVHLLASAVLDDARLWTRDQRLAAVAHDLDVAHRAHA